MGFLTGGGRISRVLCVRRGGRRHREREGEELPVFWNGRLLVAAVLAMPSTLKNQEKTRERERERE